MPPPFRGMGDMEGDTASFRLALTSQHELAIWQPAWPTRRVQSQYQQIPAAGARPRRSRRVRVWGNVPLRLMTSLMVVNGAGRN